MDDLRDLYQELILDHGRSPRNRRTVEPASHQAEGHNPLCGDRVTVTLRVEAGVIVDIAFQGQGCAISTASASTMTEALKGKRIEEAEQMFEGFHALLTGTGRPDAPLPAKLHAFTGVVAYPMRVKCATLAWHTLKSALHGSAEPISTE
jgi:nitrogen fixation NifU-like protein